MHFKNLLFWSVASHAVAFTLSATPTTSCSSNGLMEDLILQSDRALNFSPRVHLCILTDQFRVSSQHGFVITDLVHTCLSNYFMPHRDAASVSWVPRETLRRHVLSNMERHMCYCPVDHLDKKLHIVGNLDTADSVFFISPDARAFMDSHNKTFLATVATCLMTTVDKILILDMCLKPDSLI